MSSKGQYDTNKKKVLAEEAEKEKLRPFHEQFSQLGTVHYDQIFDLNIDWYLFVAYNTRTFPRYVRQYNWFWLYKHKKLHIYIITFDNFYMFSI